MPTNDHKPDLHVRHDHASNPEAPGYEITDVNVNGVVVFLSGLMGFLVVFFVFCWVMGKVINGALVKSDGPADKWHQTEESGVKGLVSNPEFQQRRLQQLTTSFPEPRVDLDDGNQQIADIHAREDLLLVHTAEYLDLAEREINNGESQHNCGVKEDDKSSFIRCGWGSGGRLRASLCGLQPSACNHGMEYKPPRPHQHI